MSFYSPSIFSFSAGHRQIDWTPMPQICGGVISYDSSEWTLIQREAQVVYEVAEDTCYLHLYLPRTEILQTRRQNIRIFIYSYIVCSYIQQMRRLHFWDFQTRIFRSVPAAYFWASNTTFCTFILSNSSYPSSACERGMILSAMNLCHFVSFSQSANHKALP